MDAETLHKISYGMYIISSKLSDKFNGYLGNTVFQTTAEPKTIAICTNKQNLTHEYIKKSKVFAVSILSKDTPMKFIGHFGFRSGKDLDKFKDVNYKLGMTGVPIVLDNTIGYLEVEVIDSLDVGTHTIFIGKIIDAEIVNSQEPMTYMYYHEVKKGKSPKTAPTYLKEEDNQQKKEDKK